MVIKESLKDVSRVSEFNNCFKIVSRIVSISVLKKFLRLFQKLFKKLSKKFPFRAISDFVALKKRPKY